MPKSYTFSLTHLTLIRKNGEKGRWVISHPAPPHIKNTNGTAKAVPFVFFMGWEMGFEPTIFSATN